MLLNKKKVYVLLYRMDELNPTLARLRVKTVKFRKVDPKVIGVFDSYKKAYEEMMGLLEPWERLEKQRGDVFDTTPDMREIGSSGLIPIKRYEIEEHIVK